MFTFAEIVATSKRSRQGQKDNEWINLDLNIDSSGDEDDDNEGVQNNRIREYEKNKRTKEATTQKKKKNTKCVKGRHSYSSAISTYVKISNKLQL